MVNLLIVHGCCKAENPERNARSKIEADNADAAAWLEGSFADLYSAYYTCALNQEVRRLGHQLDGQRFPLPGDCEPPPRIVDDADHAQFAAWLNGLDQGMAMLAGDDALEESSEAQQGWADVHTYLHPHEQGALGPRVPFRTPVWEAVAADIPPRPYVVIAHSLGSLIAVDMAREGLLQPEALVTIGSPLGIPLVSGGIEALTFDGPWLNLYDPRDAATAFGRLSPFDSGFGGSPAAHVRVAKMGVGDGHDLSGYVQASAEQLRHLLESGQLPSG